MSKEPKSPLRKPRHRKFYRIALARLGGRFGYDLANRELLVGKDALHAPASRGFPEYRAKPVFLFDRRQGRLPRDVEEFNAYWLISDRTKQVLQTTDPRGFAFLACDVQLPDGNAGPSYWLCDVIRILDAVDEERSRVEISSHRGTGEKWYVVGNAELKFNEGVVGDAHVFRNCHMFDHYIFCDQNMKDACKAAGLKGLRFEDTSKPV